MALGGIYPINQRQGAEERVRWYQAAVAVAPDKLAVHLHLAVALQDKGETAEAVAAFRHALRLDYTVVMAFHSLSAGNAAFQQALQLEPSTAVLYFDVLGEQLTTKKDWDGVIAVYTEFRRLTPKSVPAHEKLAGALMAKGDFEGAIAVYKQAIQLGPKSSLYHGLGNALMAKGDPDGAIAAYKKALRRVNLGSANAQQIELLIRLPDVLAGKDKPNSPAQACEFAGLCKEPFLKRYATAVSLYTDAFAADPKLAKTDHRYKAVCCAVLAGCGKGADAAQLEDKDKARLRGQALAWLRAEMALYHRQANPGDLRQFLFLYGTLPQWLHDADLACVRPGPDRVEMPAEERATWDQLWDEVEATAALARKGLTNKAGSYLEVPPKRG
jgi:tetratricopeptide (TPR) repeat protein